ncbi:MULTISPECIES: low affinity iron permease family protein [unclassified Legionella]|uniref:low affinity iron permease family protein n=1 Tax=unclassified Legionella TaxID=2622702 RepID=UPI001055CC9F|nr:MULTISPECIES: low affinity iron permease family protein [unclassified Legionella]MDI9818551.1 low affinity iron permease family protein [Legionella sp. PL877]
MEKTKRKKYKIGLVSLKFAGIVKIISYAAGTAWSFMLALLLILLWVLTGPVFQFSYTWQLIVNTGTTIITFLMVFLIQNTQNRDTKIINLKLDELIKSDRAAESLGVLSDEELKILETYYKDVSNEQTKSID